jgi:membrane-anchored protein YejM (alkaline phosphatase superfamily)
MKTIILFTGGTVIVAIAVFLFMHIRKQASVNPNADILLITIDTVRPDYLSCYGSSNPTPNLDQIARSGLLFENAFSQVPLTFPSHTSILTGLFPIHHSVHQNGLEIFQKPDLLISATLRKHGYKTGAVVSSFVLDRKFGLSKDFDIYDDRMERMPDIVTNFEVERLGNQTLAAAINVLNQFKNQKWFLWVHFYDPHAPHVPPPPREGYAGEISFVDEQMGNCDR